ncbi:PREDICTED: methyl-CpG-binding domain-containing protein 5-like [Camelina sativa]|uniref:Methyl-CpG-binding domain-containing protein 5-like n=1 Tax=Camelina sativa TaxID=90675 RepID=A0ABM0TGI3_CAMSA|nr:PREDICTED: methyl-CpG-binding domain-containing protein 5-like [Camelina sativa]
MSNGTDQAQPPPENTANPVDSSKSRKRATPGDDNNWLPPDWRTEVRVRTSGTKAGVVDKFYYEPITGRKFRSKNEVLYYLEHGTPKKAVKKADNNGDLHPKHSEGRGSSSRRQTKSNKKANEPPPKPVNFDFMNVPEKVTWTGTDGSDKAWWPSIGDYKIQESVSQDWDKAFTLVTTQNAWKPMF